MIQRNIVSQNYNLLIGDTKATNRDNILESYTES